MRLRSVDVLYDQYLVGPLHVSPGVLLYNGNRGTATASVPGGQSFSLGGNTFYSSAADPVRGNGTLNLGTVSPMIAATWITGIRGTPLMQNGITAGA